MLLAQRSDNSGFQRPLYLGMVVSLLLLTIAPVAIAAPKQAERNWTDKTGRFSLSATFEGVEEGKVLLKKNSGTVIRVPLDKLSSADQEAVAELLAANLTAGDNPFEQDVAESGTATMRSSKGELRANRGSVREVKYNTSSRWSFSPPRLDAPPAVSASSSIELADLPDSKKFFEEVNSLHVASTGTQALVVRKRGKVAQDDIYYLQVADLRSGKAKPLIKIPAETLILDVLPKDSLVLSRSDIFGHGKNTRVFVQQLSGKAFSPISSWEPHGTEFHSDIDTAWLLAGDRVITSPTLNKVWTIWDMNTAKALYDIPVGHGGNMNVNVLSPDRRFLAMASDASIAIVDTQTGKHVGSLTSSMNGDSGERFSGLAFSPDMQRLAGSSRYGITVWDLNTGKEYRQFMHRGAQSEEEIAWIDDYLLVDNSLLFDVERRILLWHYKTGRFGHGTKSTVQAGRLWYVPKAEKNKPSYIGSAKIPHAAARKMSERLGDAEDLLILKPGSELAVEVDVSAGDATPDAVRQAVTENLENAGFKVVEESEFVAVATCKALPSQEIKVNMSTDPMHRHRPRPQDIQTRTIVPHISRLEIRHDGEEVWAIGSLAQPGQMIWMEEGENLDAALKRLTEPNSRVLTETRFGSHIAKQGDVGRHRAFGESLLTPDGIVD